MACVPDSQDSRLPFPLPALRLTERCNSGVVLARTAFVASPFNPLTSSAPRNLLQAQHCSYCCTTTAQYLDERQLGPSGAGVVASVTWIGHQRLPRPSPFLSFSLFFSSSRPLTGVGRCQDTQLQPHCSPSPPRVPPRSQREICRGPSFFFSFFFLRSRHQPIHLLGCLLHGGLFGTSGSLACRCS